MNISYILQGQILRSQLFIRTLNSTRDLELFIFVGILSHGLGPIEDAAPIPYL